MTPTRHVRLVVLAALAGCVDRGTLQQPADSDVDTEVAPTDSDLVPADSEVADTDTGPAPCGDGDGDGVCDEDDGCMGLGVVPDDDGDGTCDDLDLCVGDDVAGDDDGDGWCDDVDPCDDRVVAPGTTCTPPSVVPVNPCHGDGWFFDGRNTGYVVCPNGAIDRLFVTTGWLADETHTTRADATGSVACRADADCAAAPHGACVSGYASYYDGWPYADNVSNRCIYGCDDDADCPTDHACLPPTVGESYTSGRSYLAGSPLVGRGVCISATCRSGADCASGECGFERAEGGCLGFDQDALRCRTASDPCSVDGDCPWINDSYLEECSFDGTGFVCGHYYESCGRPLLDPLGAPIVAPVVSASGGWAGAVIVGVPASRKARRVVASHWARIGAYEHASVASFARHALQLMALGAPADLLSEVTAAMADEVRHAQAAFGVAAALGLSAGPGPMPVDRAELHGDVDAVLVALVREGCVGETIAATEAAWLSDRCVDAGLRQVLTTLAEDEARHAALAWRTVAWLMDADAARLARVQALVAEALSTPAGPGDAEGLVGWGLIDAAGRAAVRAAVVADVIGPATAALAA